MKLKLALYFVAGLLGMVGGIILGVVIDKDTVVKIGRFKIKGEGHTVSDVIDVNLKEFKKNQRAERKRLRRLKKQNKG